MANATQLRIDAERLHQQAQDKRLEANREIMNARQYTAASDHARAQIQETLAAKCEREALDLEFTAMEHERQAIEFERRILEIDQHETELEAAHKAHLQQLERDKGSLPKDATKFRDEAERSHHQAQEKRREAERSVVQYRQYTANNDLGRARDQGAVASRCENEALALEHRAMDCEHQAAELERRILTIDQQITAIETTYKQNIQQLEREKTSLRG